MTRFAHIADILVRSFFMFVVFWLLFSYVFSGFLTVFAVSAAITVVLNAVFELTAGRKYWRKTADENKPKRPLKQVAKEFFARAFARDRTKGFVWAGTVILMMSFVVRLNAYYVIFACAVFIFAALTRFAPSQKGVIINSGQNGGQQNGGGAADSAVYGEKPGTNQAAGETVCETPAQP